MAANIEGIQFSASQLGDLVQSALSSEPEGRKPKCIHNAQPLNAGCSTQSNLRIKLLANPKDICSQKTGVYYSTVLEGAPIEHKPLSSLLSCDHLFQAFDSIR